MRKAYYLFFVLTLLFSLNSCKKDYEPKGSDSNHGANSALENLKVDENFDWRMSRDILFNLTSELADYVEITSTDGKVIYYKGSFKTKEGNSEIIASIPFTVNEVLINGEIYSLTGNQVNANLKSINTIIGPAIKDYQGSAREPIINYGLSFDGVDDYVDLGDIAELNNTSSFTIEGWANQTSNTDTEIIFGASADASNDIIVKTIGGDLQIHVGNGSDSYAFWTGYSSTLTSATWFHWAVVYDGAGITNSDRLKLYINGNTTPIVLSFSGTIPASTTSLLTGNSSSLSSLTDFFGGYMDEFRVWSDVRTPSEINANYNKLISGTATDLVAYWRMDKGTGSNLLDETTNNYHGSINGASWTAYANGWDSDADGTIDSIDDYPFDPVRAYDNYFPAADTGTLLYEDLWPGLGDYDFNDLVMGYRFKTVTNSSNEVVEIYAYFFINANGAYLNNGFGFELPDAVAGILSNVEVSGYDHGGSALITLSGSTNLESGQSNPVVIVDNSISDDMPGFSNTENWRPAVTPVEREIYIEVTGGGPFSMADFSLTTWNPFLFVDQNRDHEVHLLNYAPTDLANLALFGTWADSSYPAGDLYYRTQNNLPWALDIPNDDFIHAVEKAPITSAYLHFEEWAESSGTLYTDWYSNTSVGYRNTSYIYDPQ